jgi:TolA-binding protein
MTRRLSLIAALFLSSLTAPAVPNVVALDEPERLWLVGEHAFADGLYALASRTLGRFVERYPADSQAPPALLLLGKARLALGEFEPALDALRRAQKVSPPPGQGREARFWEAETLFRMKRYAEARAAYDDVVRNDAAGAFAADALYGYGWTELEMKRSEPAATAFRELLTGWPDHRLAPSATYQLARALAEGKHTKEALTLLRDFPQKYPGHKLVPDAQYWHGVVRLQSGDAKGGVAELKTFADAHPNHELATEARKLITQTLARSGDKSALTERYQRLMAQPTPEGLVEAAGIAGRLGRPRDQDAAWRKLKTEFAKDSKAHRLAFDLANAAFKRADWREASAYAQVAAQSEDGGMRSEAWLLTGESDLKLKRFAEAAKAFEAVGAVGNAEAAVRYRALAGLGLAREEQKELRAALAAYESVASKGPDAALREWARERASSVRAKLSKPAPAPGTKPRSG